MFYFLFIFFSFYFFFFFYDGFFFYFFFFQAEDGIRDGTVTGVQTCALPIFWRRAARRDAVRRCRQRCGLRGGARSVRGTFGAGVSRPGGQRRRPARLLAPRSEEHTSELQSQFHLVCRLLLEKKKKTQKQKKN